MDAIINVPDPVNEWATRPARENVVVVQHGASVAGVAVDALFGESSTV